MWECLGVFENVGGFAAKPSYVLVKEREPTKFFDDGILGELGRFFVLTNSFTRVSGGQLLMSQIDSKYAGFVMILKDEMKLLGLLIFEHLTDILEGILFLETK